MRRQVPVAICGRCETIWAGATFTEVCPHCKGKLKAYQVPLGDLPIRAEREIQELAAQALSRANDSRNMAKGEWPRSRRRLFWLLLVEVWELGWALLALWWAERQGVKASNYAHTRAMVLPVRRHVEHEVGDCAVFLAFILSRL